MINLFMLTMRNVYNLRICDVTTSDYSYIP